MKIVSFHIICLPDGSMTVFGLGNDNKIYQYNHEQEEWLTLKNVDMRRRLAIKTEDDVMNLIKK